MVRNFDRLIDLETVSKNHGVAECSRLGDKSQSYLRRVEGMVRDQYQRMLLLLWDLLSYLRS